MKFKKILSVLLTIMITISSLCINVNSATKMGDVNIDGTIDILDVTDIQFYLAGYKGHKFYKSYADFDHNGYVDISDVTLLQYYLAKTILPYGNFIFSIKNNTLTTTSYFGSETNVTVPSYLPGYNYTVIGIGGNTFKDNSKIATVILPANISNIENYAFNNCSNLTTVYSYNKNLKWGNSFYNCPKFKSIQFK